MEELATGLEGIEILWIVAATILPGVIDGIRRVRKHAANRGKEDSFEPGEDARGSGGDQAKVVAFRSGYLGPARLEARGEGFVEDKNESQRWRVAHS